MLRTSLPEKGQEHLEAVKARFPNRNELLAVLGVVVFVCFSWTLMGFFNQLSSYILYFKLPEIGEILALMLVIALVESLIVTGFLVILAALLPGRWLREDFAVKSFVIVVVFAAASAIFQRSLDNYLPSLTVLLTAFLVPLALVGAILWFLRPRPGLQRVMLNVLERIQIMLLVYIPLGLLSLAVTLYQTLL